MFGLIFKIRRSRRFDFRVLKFGSRCIGSLFHVQLFSTFLLLLFFKLRLYAFFRLLITSVSVSGVYNYDIHSYFDFNSKVELMLNLFMSSIDVTWWLPYFLHTFCSFLSLLHKTKVVPIFVLFCRKHKPYLVVQDCTGLLNINLFLFVLLYYLNSSTQKLVKFFEVVGKSALRVYYIAHSSII